ncbi:MAG: tetratricopeptide repeat protein [Verrucomicrobiota bacterium]
MTTQNRFIVAFSFLILLSCERQSDADAQAELYPEKPEIKSLIVKAEQGDALAQHNLGYSYYAGEGVEKNETEALKWFRKAAKQGLAKAQYNLGGFYQSGTGVEKNETEAVSWYRKASEQGFAKAQFKLGLCHMTGKGVVKNEAEAVRWYRKAAEQGDASAQLNLGDAYFNGIGLEKNTFLGYQWMLLVAANANTLEETKKITIAIAQAKISLIERELTNEQRAEGQRLATEWQAAFEKKQKAE